MDFKNVLQFRIGYAYILLAFLLFINFLSQSQAVFSEQDWSAVAANNLHFILIVVAFISIVAVDLKYRGRGEMLKENAPNFGKTLLFGAGWFFIFVALSNVAIDLSQQVLMLIYFGKGAAIEEITFRYALPRLFNMSGYGFWISQIISNMMFAFAHYFVWSFTISSAIIGMLFGLAQVLAFAYGRSFLGIVWGHTLYNLALAGANAWFMVAITVMIIVTFYVRDKIG
jgi:hypothetical protein